MAKIVKYYGDMQDKKPVYQIEIAPTIFAEFSIYCMKCAGRYVYFDMSVAKNERLFLCQIFGGGAELRSGTTMIPHADCFGEVVDWQAVETVLKKVGVAPKANLYIDVELVVRREYLLTDQIEPMQKSLTMIEQPDEHAETEVPENA